ARATGRRGAARCLPSRSLLAVHGYATRQTTAGSALAGGTGAVEGGGGMSSFWQDRPTLVTGATGLVGGWVVQRLLAREADVVCLVRDWVPDAEFVRAGLASRVKLARGDICDQACLERVLGEYEIDTVLHLAAQTIVPIANRNPISTFESNIGGT